MDGNITSRTLVIAEGAMFSGQSIMGEQGAQGAGSSPAQRGEPSASKQDEPTQAGQAEPARA